MTPKLDTKNLIQIGCRVGTDKQHLLAPIGQRNRSGTGKGGFPNAPFPREEEEACGLIDQTGNREIHHADACSC